MYRQRCPMPGEGFQVIAVDDDINVAVGCSVTGLWQRIQPVESLKIRGIDPTGENRCRQIIKRRLAALLVPALNIVGILDRQPQAVGRQMLDQRIMPYFVVDFKDGNDGTRPYCQEQITAQNEIEITLQSPFLTAVLYKDTHVCAMVPQSNCRAR